MRAVLGMATMLLWLVAPSAVHGQAGAPLADPSRAAALAEAVVARPGETGAVATNPGSLADVERSAVSLTAHAARLDQHFARPGEAALEMDRTLAGVGVGLVGRMPGPEWAPWLERLRIGLGAHVPTAQVLRLSAPSRPDRPTSVIYGDRAARTAVVGSLGVELPWGLGLGVGVSLTPSLETETIVGYDASRGDSPDDNVVIDVENRLVIDSALLAGIRFAPVHWVALGAAWRQQQAVDAQGPNDIRAGTLVVDAEVDFHEFFAPEQLVVGALLAPLPRLSISADVAWSRWSGFHTIHDRAPEPAFEDVVSLRVGAEWSATDAYTVRAGYGWEPSPVPEQTAVSSYVDGDRHVLAMGAGLDLESLGWARMRVDVHARWHVIARQQAEKDVAALPDADREMPGHQIDNLGYPGFRAGGRFVQAGLTVTFPLEPPEAP